MGDKSIDPFKAGHHKGQTKMIEDTYWGEAVDQYHRGFNVLNKIYNKYKQAKQEDSNMKKSFWEYAGETDKGQAVQAFDSQKRANYECVISKAGKIKPKGGLHLKGDDIIFALSPEGKLYCNKKDIGKFHHSTFLAYMPVASAGTMKTDNEGVLVEVNDSSGHYKPGAPEMLRVVKYLSQLNLDVGVWNALEVKISKARILNEKKTTFSAAAVLQDWCTHNDDCDAEKGEACCLNGAVCMSQIEAANADCAPTDFFFLEMSSQVAV